LPVPRDRGYQVDDLVDEAVLVAETVPWRPPGTHVRVLRLGNKDPPIALFLDRLRAEKLQQIVLLEVEGERAVGAVDLDPQRVLRPRADRLASKTPMAPPANRAVNAASSTVTSPRGESALDAP
jgi:hypothetical protein